MESGSDGEEDQMKNTNINNSSEGQTKTKRQMKTPFQLETLEKIYSVETYPSEATRAELSEKLGLTDRQLQMWFCHRRLKDKKDNPTKKPRKTVPDPQPESPVNNLRVGHDAEYGSGSRSASGSRSGSAAGSSPYIDSRKLVTGSSTSLAVMGDYEPMGRRYHESPQAIMERRAIARVEAQLGEAIREDGPIFGMEFEALPPGAFGLPIGRTVEQQKHTSHPYESKLYEHSGKSNKATIRAVNEYQFFQDQSCFRSDTNGEITQSHLHETLLDGTRPRSSSYVLGNEPMSRVHGVHGHASRSRVSSQQDRPGNNFSSRQGSEILMLEKELVKNDRISASPSNLPSLRLEESQGPNSNNDPDARADKKQKMHNEEVRIAKDTEAQEIRMRKEIEKLDIQKRRNEERMKKDMERLERERRKEEERLMRERQKEDERLQREQKREQERREKFLQKEYARAEKQRQKEDLRKEREEVRRKIAVEKATARKIAKESMDLIEDEQLELMELAAASKGLHSVIKLDHDTLQNLDIFRDSLRSFPPNSVHIKRPFAFQPWKDSDENVGNLLMVWRFLIAFADVLGLWPFTLDEFVQGFHDYDSRLLGEIHIALLKLIIKDIEDVARTPATGLGTNQYTSINPEGGHPHIVEGAYTWGFNIRNWQLHLSPLTWPEILRQLALSSGLGPSLKKRSGQWTSLYDNEESKGCRDVVSTLRNGSAAESAFALMREKGLLLPRRSRHRLTPGTVKFAAFHVLSLEGGKGLTVLELADKIQKSGLRDLTTSKTPEASISVALTRDAKLFERIAPSTYCVRTPYRKDPVDTDSILAAARKKIRIFENGFLGGDDVDDVERDEDSECDVDEDPEVDDLATLARTTKTTDVINAVNTCSGSGKDMICNNIVENVPEKEFSSFPSSISKNAISPSNTVHQIGAGDTPASMNQQNVEIDYSKMGESWVQGLTEGDYSHLCVEERLKALVTLIGIANEGNSIRAILEDRLEAANALKKQMWAEAQVDKSRMKEENSIKPEYSPSPGIKGFTQNEACSSTPADLKPSQITPNNLNNCNQDAYMTPDNMSIQQHGYTSKKSRSELKSYIAHRAEEMCIYRSLPLGQDRRRNRYWQFAASASKNDPCSGRIFVELHNGKWRLIDTAEAFDSLVTSLDTRGIRESHLRIMLQQAETSFKQNIRRNLSSTNICGANIKDEATEMDYTPDSSITVCGSNSDSKEISHSFKVELAKNDIEKKNSLKRYHDLQRWMWSACYSILPPCGRKYGKKRLEPLLVTCEFCLDSYLSDHTRCPSCQQTHNMADNSSEYKINFEDFSLPVGERLLKAMISLIEVYVPPEALESFWTEDHRKNWGMKLIMSSSTEELLQLLTQLETAIKKEYLSSDFETTKEVLRSNQSTNLLGSVPVLPWIPQTTAAVCMRLLEFDACLRYVKEEHEEPSSEKDIGQYIKLPSRLLSLKGEGREVDQDEASLPYIWSEPSGNKRGSYKRGGRGGREPVSGRKLPRKVVGPKSDLGRRKTKVTDNLALSLRPQGRNGQSSGRGRRTVRKRADRRVFVDPCIGGFGRSKNTTGHMPKILEDGWVGERNRAVHNDAAENSNSMEEVESDENVQMVESDDNAQAVEYDRANWAEVGFEPTPNAWTSRSLMEGSDDDEEEEDVYVDDGNRVEEDVEMSEGSDRNVNNFRAGADSDSEYSDEYSDG